MLGPDHPGGVPQPHRPDQFAGAVPRPGAPGTPQVTRQHGRFVPGMPAMQAEGPGRPAAPPPGGHPQAPRAPDAAPGRGTADFAQHGGRTPPQGNMAQTGPHWAAQGGVPTAQASGPMEAPAVHGDAGRAMNRHGRPAATPQPMAAQAGPQATGRGAAPHSDMQQHLAVRAPQPVPRSPAPQPHPQPAAHPPAPHPQSQSAPHAPTPHPQPAANPSAPHAPPPAPQSAPRPAPHEAPHPPVQAAHPQPQPHGAPQHGPDKGGDHGHKKGEQGGH